jgi:hypothetical protein
MLDIFGSGADACVSSQHLDIAQTAANLADSRPSGSGGCPAKRRVGVVPDWLYGRATLEPTRAFISATILRICSGVLVPMW